MGHFERETFSAVGTLRLGRFAMGVFVCASIRTLLESSYGDIWVRGYMCCKIPLSPPSWTSLGGGVEGRGEKKNEEMYMVGKMENVGK